MFGTAIFFGFSVLKYRKRWAFIVWQPFFFFGFWEQTILEYAKQKTSIRCFRLFSCIFHHELRRSLLLLRPPICNGDSENSPHHVTFPPATVMATALPSLQCPPVTTSPTPSDSDDSLLPHATSPPSDTFDGASSRSSPANSRKRRLVLTADWLHGEGDLLPQCFQPGTFSFLGLWLQSEEPPRLSIYRLLSLK